MEYDNTTVASVDGNGVIIALSPGTAIISVQTNDGGFTDTSTISVSDVVTGVEDTKIYKMPLNIEPRIYYVSVIIPNKESVYYKFIKQ